MLMTNDFRLRDVGRLFPDLYYRTAISFNVQSCKVILTHILLMLRFQVVSIILETTKPIILTT